MPGLQPYHHQLEEIYGRFNAYKQTIPTMGAIILEPNTEKCLLVKGYRAADGWGFPTGKINRDEADDSCAVREARCTCSDVYNSSLFMVPSLTVGAKLSAMP